MNKGDFFKRLDLVSFEGRVAANNLIKRLGLFVFVQKLGRTNELYWITKNNAIPLLFSAETSNLLFYLTHRGEEIQFGAMHDEYVDLQMAQGEINEVQAILLKTEDWDELPPDILTIVKAEGLV